MISDRRRRKKTWGLIRQELEENHGVKLAVSTVRNFFKRAAQGRLPLGVVSHAPAARPRVSAVSATVLTRTVHKQFQEQDNDPFSTKVIAFDPWKPQRKNKAS
jgi:hypothetical protein